MFPSEHRLSGGVVGGAVRGSAAEPAHTTQGGHFTYRGTIAPLAMVPVLWDRDVDFGLGYFFTVSEIGSLQHGPTLDVSYFLLRGSLDTREPCGDRTLPPSDEDPCTPEGEHQLFRLAFRAEVDLRFTDAEPGAVGVGGRGGLRLDFSFLAAQPEPVAEASSRGGFVGALWGEYGIALDVLGGGGFVGQQAYAELVVGLTFRAPAVAGLAIVVP